MFGILVRLAACDPSDADKGPGPDDPPDDPPGPDVVVGFAWEWVDTGSCEVPTPRRYPQVAGFVAPTTFEYRRGDTTRRTESGFVLYGGEDVSGSGDGGIPGRPLNDLWVFDPAEDCPWTLLTEDADPGSDGVAHGHLYQSSANDTFLLVGGRASLDGTWTPRASTAVLASLASTFVDDLRQSGFTARHVRGGSPYCTEFPGGGSDTFDCTCVSEEVAGVVVCPIRDTSGAVISSTTPGLVYSRWRFGISETNEDSRRAAICEQARGGVPLGSDWGYQPDLLCEPGVGSNPQETSVIATYGCGLGCDAAEVDTLFVSCDVDPFCADDAPLAANGAARLERTFSWEGWYAAAGAVDPASFTLETYGGTAGCMGDCDGDPGVTLDDDLDRTQSLHATNRPAGQRWSSFVGGTTTQWVEPWNPDRLFDETVGVRNGAMGRLGLSWDIRTRQWTTNGDNRLLIGGTLQQDVEPSRQLDLNDEMDASVAWLRFQGMEGDEREDRFFVPALRLVSGEVASTVRTDLPEGLDRAAVALHPDWVAILGGRPYGGLRIVNRDGRIDLDDPMPDVYGAAGAFDPVRGSAYFLGAFDLPADAENPARTEARVLRVWPLTAPRAQSRVDAVLDRVETRLVVRDPTAADPTTEPWDTEVATRFYAQCSLEDSDPAGSCWSRTLNVTVSAGFVDGDLDPVTEEAAQLAQLRADTVFELLIPGSDTPVPLEVFDLEPRQNQSPDLLNVVLRSPVAIHGLRTGNPLLYELHVRGPMLPVSGATIVDTSYRPRWTPYGADGPLCTADVAWSLDSLPVTLNGRSFGTVLESRPESPWHSVEVRPPDGFRTIGPMYTTVCPGILLLDPWVDPAPRDCFRLDDAAIKHFPFEGDRFHLVVRPHTAPPIPVIAEDGASSWVWVDECLDADLRTVATSWTVSDATPTARTYLSEQTWLAERIRSSATEGTERTLALWLGRGEADAAGEPNVAVGLTRGSLVQLMPFHPTGSRGSQEPSELAEMLDAVATHELAHVATAGRYYEDATAWLQESIPTLLQLERVPGFQPDTLRLGLTLRQAAFVRDDRFARPLKDLTRSEVALPWLKVQQRYTVGPYLLAQAFAEGGAGLDPRPSWRSVRDSLLPTSLATWGTATSPTDVDAVLTSIGAPDFYEDRILGARFGEPLVSVGVVETAGARSLEVRQVQDRLYSILNMVPFDLHPKAPWALACAVEDDGPSLVDRPYSECAAAGAGLVDVVRLHDGNAGVEAVPLTVQPVDDTAVWFAAFSGGQMLPGQVGAFALLSGAEPALTITQASTTPAAPTFWLDCEAGSASPACTAFDADSDGYVPDADCATLDPTTHPNADEPLPTEDPWTIDHDCDGWPGDFQLDPTREVL